MAHLAVNKGTIEQSQQGDVDDWKSVEEDQQERKENTCYQKGERDDDQTSSLAKFNVWNQR